MPRSSSLVRRLQKYSEGSASPFFGAVTVLPLVAFYEAGLFAARHGGLPIVRNGVDVAFRAMLGPLPPIDLGLLVALGALALAVWAKTRNRSRFRIEWVGYLLLESVFWALALLVFLRICFALHLAVLGGSAVAGLGAISGAAVFEELAFRVGVLGGLRWLFGRLQAPKWLGWNVSLWTASFSFAAAHYYGPLGQPLSSESLFSHILVGLGLGLVYLLRGFAPAVYTHAFYDVFVAAAV